MIIKLAGKFSVERFAGFIVKLFFYIIILVILSPFKFTRNRIIIKICEIFYYLSFKNYYITLNHLELLKELLKFLILNFSKKLKKKTEIILTRMKGKMILHLNISNLLIQYYSTLNKMKKKTQKVLNDSGKYNNS